jgi:hypothetical protein
MHVKNGKSSFGEIQFQEYMFNANQPLLCLRTLIEYKFTLGKAINVIYISQKLLHRQC